MTDHPFAGRAALVTGASSGIGRAIAERLLDEGACVLISSRSIEADGGDLAARYGAARVAAEPADVRRREQVQRLVDACVRRFGRLDIAIANAGVDEGAPFLDIDDESWDRVVDTNLRGAFHTTQISARAMGDHGGRIVLIASTNAHFPETNLASYNAAKAGVVGLMRSAAIELAPRGINVNAVGPGLVHTGMTDGLVQHPVYGPRYLERIPCGRFGTPADVAAAVVYLVSDGAAWVTGHHLVVDGGQTIGFDLPLDSTDGSQ